MRSIKGADIATTGVYKNLFSLEGAVWQSKSYTGKLQGDQLFESVGKNVCAVNQALLSQVITAPWVTADTWKQTAFALSITVLVGQLHCGKLDLVHSAQLYWPQKWILLSSETLISSLPCINKGCKDEYTFYSLWLFPSKLLFC